jgi:hypothetical protein
MLQDRINIRTPSNVTGQARQQDSYNTQDKINIRTVKSQDKLNSWTATMIRTGETSGHQASTQCHRTG